MHLDFRWKIYKELLQRLLLITVFFCCFFFRAMFAPACLSHEVITRKWVLFIFKRPLPRCTIFYLCADSALLCCVLAIGLMCRLKAPPCPERCTAGTAASTTTGTTRLRLKAVLCIWLTAARGHTATPPAPPSEISSQGRRWMSFSSSCTWALMCRRWPSSREWTPASYWACSAVAAKRTQTHRHYLNVKLSRVGWLVSLASLPTYNEFPLTSCLLYSKPQSVQGLWPCPTIPFLPSGDKYCGNIPQWQGTNLCDSPFKLYFVL